MSVLGTNSITGILSQGPMIINDWAITIEDINGGHRLTARRGSDIQTMDILNGVDAPVPDIKITDVEHGHDVTITVGDVAKTFYIHDGVDAPVPEIYVEAVQGGHKVIAAVGDTVKSFTVMDGVDGKDGKTPVKNVDYFDGKDGYSPVKNKDYFDGKDGISPVVKVTDIENGHRVTITTGNDVQSFDVLDGKDGEDAEGGTVEVDPTLSIEGMAADAKATGDAIKAIGSGGTAQVQSDYKQHDASKADYVKNRPFWPEWSPVLYCEKLDGISAEDDYMTSSSTFDFEIGSIPAPEVGKHYTFGIGGKAYSGTAVRGYFRLTVSPDSISVMSTGIVSEENGDIFVAYRETTSGKCYWFAHFLTSDVAGSINEKPMFVIEGDNLYNKLSAANDALDMTGIPEGVSIVYDLTKLYNAASSGDVKSGNMYAALQNDVEITVDMNGAEITLTSADLVFAPNQNMMGFECDLYMYGGQVPLAGIVHDGDYRSLALLDLNALGMAQITTKSIKVNYPGIFAPTIAAKKVPDECMPGAAILHFTDASNSEGYIAWDVKGNSRVTKAELESLVRIGREVWVSWSGADGTMLMKPSMLMFLPSADYAALVMYAKNGTTFMEYYAYTAEYTGA